MNLITYLSHNKGLSYLVRQPIVVYTGFCITGFVSEAGLVEIAERIQHILCLMTYAGWLLLCREITVTNDRREFLPEALMVENTCQRLYGFQREICCRLYQYRLKHAEISWSRGSVRPAGTTALPQTAPRPADSISRSSAAEISSTDCPARCSRA